MLATFRRISPLVVFLPLQAILYFWNLGLLSAWFDEAATMVTMPMPVGQTVAYASSGGHPPLYFLIVFGWMKISLGISPVVQARILSVFFSLLATWAADYYWGRTLEPRLRIWFLALWCLSPFLLLYSRMCRSYSLQLLLGTVTTALLLRFCGKERRQGPILALALAVTLYVHYVPGGALLAAANLCLLRDRRWRDAFLLDSAVGVLLLPWVWRMISSLGMWGAHTRTYAVTGSTLTDIPVKLAYWAMSFTIGETTPDLALIAGGFVLLATAVLLILGARQRADLVWLAVPAAIVGFIGVTRWVAYPFIPARMIFLYPVFLLLVVTGAQTARRAGTLVLGTLLLLSVSGIACYFAKTGFRNKEYPIPLDQIAARIAPTDVVLVDSSNSDTIGMEYALGTHPVLKTADAQTPVELPRLLADPQTRTVWFLRSTHDVSPEQRDARFESQLQSAMRETVHGYAPYSPLEKRLLHAMGVPHPPDYFQELLEFRR